MKKLHYENSGANYKLIDTFKVQALNLAKTTAKNLKRFKKYGLEIKELKNSRGESAYRIEVITTKPISFQLAHVEESIGTKNVIADELIELTGKSYYYEAAIDNVASIVNDLATCGAFPVSFMLHVAAYPNEWFLDSRINKLLLQGTADACNLAGLTWGGGESGTDRDIIIPGKSLLSGSAVGIITPSDKALNEDKIKVGDRIILLSSSGVHTNGITLLRQELLKKLPQGYKTMLADGKNYGETLMTPSIIYSKLVEDIVSQTKIHYAVNITGHGFRKIMRPKRSLTYVIDKLPTPQPIFELIKKYSNSTDQDMYDTYNMGAGFALYLPESSVKTVLRLAKKHKIVALDAGVVQKGTKKVVLKPLGIELKGESLQIR